MILAKDFEECNRLPIAQQKAMCALLFAEFKSVTEVKRRYRLEYSCNFHQRIRLRDE